MTGADRTKAMAAVQALLDRYKLIVAERERSHVPDKSDDRLFDQPFDHTLMHTLKLVDAGMDGSVVYELHMAPCFSNINNVMHGGAAGVIFDMATTSALCPVARPGFWEFMGGVTRTLNISYLKAVPVGITVRLSSKVESVGKQMAMIRGVMTSLDGKTTYCTAEHHKVNAPVLPDHVKVRLAWDDEFERQWARVKL